MEENCQAGMRNATLTPHDAAGDLMQETHRLVVDRHEEDRTVVAADDAGFFDLPRWLLPTATRGNDVISVTVEAEADRAVITLVRDASATARGEADAKAIVERLQQRDPGGDVRL
jgi:hypothetical protein